MADETAIASLLHEVAETHHVVYRITDGADDERSVEDDLEGAQ